MTKNLFIIIFCILFPIIAEGADWVKVNESEGGSGSVDISTIKQTAPNQYRAWYKIELINNESLKEARKLASFDCVKKRLKDLQSTYYLINGKTSTDGEKEWKYVLPESNVEYVLNFVCTYKKDVLNIPKREDSPVTTDDILIEKPEVQEFPISEEQTAVEEKALELPKAEKGVDGHKPVVQSKKSFNGMYYVQIGTWKNPDLAEKMFNKVREKYHETHIIVENNLHKVRILGVRTKQEGMDISQDIEKTFNVRPIVVRNPQ